MRLAKTFFREHADFSSSLFFPRKLHRVKVRKIRQLIVTRLLSFNKISVTYLFHYTETSLLVNHNDRRGSQSEKQQFSSHLPFRSLSLLPLPASASAASGGGPGSSAALRWAGCYVDLSLLDLAAGLWQQVLDLLLRFQVEHHVSELLLQLLYGRVLQVACRTTVAIGLASHNRRGHLRQLFTQPLTRGRLVPCSLAPASYCSTDTL